ncbi:MAG: cysteine hydrolase [Desulfobacteraceae bacterium]|nr:cysteine hydrolase [Desulfobacteraceae bacterium]
MNPAVLIIDLQVGLFEESENPFDFENVIERINKITFHARENKWPVIFIQHEQEKGLLQHGSEGWALIPELQTESSDFYIRKTTPNSFVKTNLSELLNQHNIDNLIICGYATEFCVDSTIRGGAALGYSIQIASDAHTTRDKKHASAKFIRKHHNETLSNITSFGVPIKTIKSEEIINID